MKKKRKDGGNSRVLKRHWGDDCRERELVIALLPVPLSFYSVLYDSGSLRVREGRGGSERVA